MRTGVTRGAKLHLAGKALPVVSLLALAAGGCTQGAAYPYYDPDTRLITRIDYDTDGDGRIEAHLYYYAGQAVRLEADGNGDGIVDRWEEYAREGELRRLGTSSAADGRVDTWARQTGTQLQVDISTRRDGAIDRREYHDNGVLTRTEQDTNRDGRVDQWQRFEQGRLREVMLDTTFSAGRPDQRLVYSDSGDVDVQR